MAQLFGVTWLVVTLLYGAGLRLQECLELRVEDVDFERRELVIRRGKGQKDRRTMLPTAVEERLRAHLQEVRRQHERDVAAGGRTRRVAGGARPKVSECGNGLDWLDISSLPGSLGTAGRFQRLYRWLALLGACRSTYAPSDRA